jgi:hypothetical protein
MSRVKIRYGQSFTVCTNAAWWNSVRNYNPSLRTFQRGSETFQIEEGSAVPPQFGGANHIITRVRQYWEDTYTEAYWDLVTANFQIVGAQVAQTFLNANDIWATKIGFYLSEKAAQENIYLTICELTAGVPDHERVIAHQTVLAANLVAGQWVRTSIKPTFLKGGKKYAILLSANANHKIGMAYGQRYIDGTFFYTTDGSWYRATSPRT